jgi:photosystem II stability/assembly factor-like uncharacterized protein
MTATGDSGWAVGDRAMGLRRLMVLGVLVLLCVLVGGIGAGNARASSGAATTWKAQDASSAGKSGGLVSVTFADAAHGWAVGVNSRNSPVILATSDGGATWKAQDAASAGNAAQLQSVTSTDATHAWAVGYAIGTTRNSPVILATNDGGATWKAQDASSAVNAAQLNSVTFSDAAHGWAVGYGPNPPGAGGPVILATSDGGATWKAQDARSVANDALLFSVTATDATHAWAAGYAVVESATVGDSPVILATSDGGATWKAQDASSAGIEAHLKSVTFSDAAHGWAVGDATNHAGVSAPVILATSDGGATWKAQDASSAGKRGVLLSATFTDAAHGWAVGSAANGTRYGGSVILATSDGGATWSAQDAASAGKSGGLFSVTSTDATHGWAVGVRYGKGSTPLSAPVILATTTGGGQAGPKLTLKLSGLKSGALKLGRSVTTKGTATPTSLAGSNITLTVERMSGGAWRNVKSMTAQIAFSGAYGGKFKPAEKGSYRIRARVAKTVASTAAASAWKSFKVR